jgi:hypothetical protein
MLFGSNLEGEVNLAEGPLKIFVDTCASDMLMILTQEAADQAEMDDIVMRNDQMSIGLTGQNQVMNVEAIAKKGDWTNIYIIPDSRKSIVATTYLKDRGYALIDGNQTFIYKKDDETMTPVLVCSHSNGMPYVLLSELFDLERIPEVHQLQEFAPGSPQYSPEYQAPEYSPYRGSPQYSPDPQSPQYQQVYLDNEGEEDEFGEGDESEDDEAEVNDREISPVARERLGFHIAEEGRCEQLHRRFEARSLEVGVQQAAGEMFRSSEGRELAEEQNQREMRAAQKKAGRDQREADGKQTVDDLFWTKSDDDESSDDNSL